MCSTCASLINRASSNCKLHLCSSFISAMSATKVKIGIIGGTGFDDPDLINNRTEKCVDTPFGKPSDVLVCGKISGVDCVVLARHAKGHLISPSYINYRANIHALKSEGCTHILGTSACGSLQEEVKKGDAVFVDQFIDRTYKRETTFYDGKPGSPVGICHIPMHEPVCPETRKILIEAAQEENVPFHEKGTYICIEGPRFSSRAESKWFQSLGANIIGMTFVPEVCLAKEAGLCYATIAMATDYDTWKEDEEPVTVEGVRKALAENIETSKRVILRAIPKIAAKDWTEVLRQNQETLKNALMLPPEKSNPK